MLNIEYNFDVKEFANASLTYMEKNVFIKILIFIMNLSCYLTLIGYLLKYHSESLIPFDHIAIIFALCWIILRRKINKFLLQRHLNKINMNKNTAKINLSETRISWQNKNNSFNHITWNKIKKVYSTKKGYIIPKVNNAPLDSTFLWIPKTSFNAQNKETEFLKYLTENKVKLT